MMTQWCEPINMCSSQHAETSAAHPTPQHSHACHCIRMFQGKYLQLSDEGDVWVVHDDKGWAHIPEQPFLVGVECCKADIPQQGPPILLYHCPCAVHSKAHSCNVLFQQMQRLQLSQS
jgi:hypothetical protein